MKLGIIRIIFLKAFEFGLHSDYYFIITMITLILDVINGILAYYSFPNYVRRETQYETNTKVINKVVSISFF